MSLSESADSHCSDWSSEQTVGPTAGSLYYFDNCCSTIFMTELVCVKAELGPLSSNALTVLALTKSGQMIFATVPQPLCLW